MTRVLVLIPAYNEAVSLPAVVGDLRAHYPAADLVVIDDGSTDDTATVARRLGVPVLALPYNLGIGGAVQTGLLFAARQGYDCAVQFDGDGQHRADQLPALLAPVLGRQADVVIGSRFLSPAAYSVPLLRRCGIAIFRRVNGLVLGRTITDNTSGFRAYGRAALAFLAEEYPHDYPEPESVVTLCRQGFRVVEVPAQMRERQGGHSSITLVRSLYYMCKVLLAIGVRATERPVGRVHDESAHPDYLGSR
jgi:glycosyltransferase involved in cell wall biosynthesis